MSHGDVASQRRASTPLKASSYLAAVLLQRKALGVKQKEYSTETTREVCNLVSTLVAEQPAELLQLIPLRSRGEIHRARQLSEPLPVTL